MEHNVQSMLSQSVNELAELLPKLVPLGDGLSRLGAAMMACWNGGGKVLIAGNGGSAADGMHFAEELVVRFHDDRRALAAIALCDASVLSCIGNDYGYERAFSRQIEALGNRGDVLIVMTTSGNSPNILKAIDMARSRGLITAAFLGKDGGKARGLCDIEMLVPSQSTARIQEAHKLLFHTLCGWVDSQVR